MRWLLLLWMTRVAFGSADLISLIPTALKGEWQSQSEIARIERTFQTGTQLDKVTAAYRLTLAPEKWVRANKSTYRQFLLSHPTLLE